MLRPRARALLALLGVVVIALVASSGAWAIGELSQKPGAAGCISEEVASGCQPARSIPQPIDVAISPDGRNVYVLAREGGFGTMAIFDRDPASGELTQKPGTAGCIARAGECQHNGLGIAPSAIAVSPDGKSLYVTSSRVVFIFGRTESGALTQSADKTGCISEGGSGGGCEPARGLEDASSIAVSPDGTSVYVASVAGELAAFKRVASGPATGQLSQEGGMAACFAVPRIAECEPGRALDGAFDVVVSPDGKNVYVASSAFGGVAVFDRNGDSGGLRQKSNRAGCINSSGTETCRIGNTLDGVRHLAISPDGKHLYVSNPTTDAVLTFGRSLQSGELHQRPDAAGCISATTRGGNCQQGRGLVHPEALAVSPDGDNVYVPSAVSRAVSILDRNLATGFLTQKPGMSGCISITTFEGCQLGTAFGSATSLAVSPDGRNVYVVVGGSNAIAILDRVTPPPPPPSPDTVAPQVSGFKLAPARFKAGAKGGSHFRFTLSEPTSVKITVERAEVRRHSGKRFVHPVALGFGDRSAGANSIAFGGKVGKRSLAAGSYRATILATDAAGNRSAPRRASFTVLAAKPRVPSHHRGPRP